MNTVTPSTTFVLDEFRTSQRVLDIAALSAISLCAVAAVVLLLLVALMKIRGSPFDRRLPKFAVGCSFAALLGIAIAMNEGASRLVLTHDSVEVEYRFRPARQIVLDDIRAARFVMIEPHVARKRRDRATLRLSLSDGELNIKPLAKTRHSTDELTRAADAIQERIERRASPSTSSR